MSNNTHTVNSIMGKINTAQKRIDSINESITKITIDTTPKNAVSMSKKLSTLVARQSKLNSELNKLKGNLALAEKQLLKPAKSNKPTISTLKKIQNELTSALKGISENHGVALSVVAANVSPRGIVSVGIKSGRSSMSGKEIKGGAPTHLKGETNPEYRFRLFHKEAGVNDTLLNSIIKISDKSMKVLGLRGRSNKVVLVPSKGKGKELLVDISELSNAEIITPCGKRIAEMV